jgi:TolB protein
MGKWKSEGTDTPGEKSASQVERPEGSGRLARARDSLRRLARRVIAPPLSLWGHLRTAWLWLVKPEAVGKPVTLGPRPMRSLVLLVAGSATVLILLVAALYHIATAPLPTHTPSLATGATLPPGAGTDGTPTPFACSGAIAFTLRRAGNADIYALNQADRQLVRLTHNPAEDRDPTWSPDGSYLAFASNRSDNWDIYLLDLVSGILIRLTHDPAFDAHPSWSPDGEWIAFESYRGGNLDIYVMSTRQDEIRRITRDRAPDYAPAWTPDGSAIAFTSLRDGNKEVYVQTLDAPVETVNLTNSPDLDEDDPAWSPDGDQLAYSSGPSGDRSTHVVSVDWTRLGTDPTQAETFAEGYSPCWAPEGETLTYAYGQDSTSHVVAASVTAWAQFHEVFSIEGPLDDLEWTSQPLETRVVARAQADLPDTSAVLYVEMVQPAAENGPPHDFVTLGSVQGAEGMFLSEAVNDSFDALRDRILEEAGWDYLGTLTDAGLPTYHTPPNGHSRMSYHVCGRAIDVDTEPYEETPPGLELVKEEIGTTTYWRVYIRAARQDGSMGEPLREPVWDLLSREEGGPASIEGGSLRDRVPAGYYVDFTTLAGDYGWERVASLWRWRYSWEDLRWWQFEKTEGLTWWECMLQVYEPGEIEPAFGPIPGLEE